MRHIPLGPVASFVMYGFSATMQNAAREYNIRSAKNRQNHKAQELPEPASVLLTTQILAREYSVENHEHEFLTEPQLYAKTGKFNSIMDIIYSPAFGTFCMVASTALMFFIPGIPIVMAFSYLSINVAIKIFGICQDIRKYNQLKQIQLDTIILEDKLALLGKDNFEANVAALEAEAIESSRGKASASSFFQVLPYMGYSIAGIALNLSTGNIIGGTLNILTSALGFGMLRQNDIAWSKDVDFLKKYNQGLLDNVNEIEKRGKTKYEPGCLGVKFAQGNIETAVKLTSKSLRYSEFIKEFTPRYISREVHDTAKQTGGGKAK